VFTAVEYRRLQDGIPLFVFDYHKIIIGFAWLRVVFSTAAASNPFIAHHHVKDISRRVGLRLFTPSIPSAADHLIPSASSSCLEARESTHRHPQQVRLSPDNCRADIISTYLSFSVKIAQFNFFLAITALATAAKMKKCPCQFALDPDPHRDVNDIL